MLTPEPRTEHEARAAAAAAKARAALTPRSTSSGQAHYGELRLVGDHAKRRPDHVAAVVDLGHNAVGPNLRQH